LIENETAHRRSTPWRLSDELPDGDGVEHAETVAAPAWSPVHDLLERREISSDSPLRRRSAKSTDRSPILMSWGDPERRGWLLLAVLSATVLFLTVAQGVLHGLDRPVRPASLSAIPTERARPTNAAQADAPSHLWDDLRITEGTGIPANASLPIAVGAIWLLGAWVVDREARRAFVVPGTWTDRPSVAYGVIALFVVTPIIVGGMTQAAWGVVHLLIAYVRAGGAQAGWRATAWLAGIVVAFLVLRLPTLAGVRWVAGEVLRLGRTAVAALISMMPRRERLFHFQAMRRRSVSYWSREGQR
jgi:hypothetical protein